MNECECLDGCLFFKGFLKNMPANAELTRQEFCLGNYSACARYMVFRALGKVRVPDTLFPRDADTAHEIIAGG